MRRVSVFLCLVGLALSNVGCVMVIGVKDLPHRKQAVEIDGELYIVDVRTQRARKIDLNSETEIESATETQIEIADD